LVGENGSGKTNVHRGLRLLREGAEGHLATTLLEEGGMPSVLLGRERRLGKGEPVRTIIGVEIDEISYELALGLPSLPSGGPFVLDPEVKEEVIWIGQERSGATTIADRAGTTVILNDLEGRRVSYPATLDSAEPLLSQISDPGRYPEVFALRNHLERWRFYHEFSTGSAASARSAQVGVRTPVLSDDGHDLAAAITTIFQIGDGHVLRAAVDHAFPGSTVETEVADGVHTLLLHQPGLRRPATAVPVSIGTLRRAKAKPGR
jgi:predicted ATPase